MYDCTPAAHHRLPLDCGHMMALFCRRKQGPPYVSVMVCEVCPVKALIPLHMFSRTAALVPGMVAPLEGPALATTERLGS